MSDFINNILLASSNFTEDANAFIKNAIAASQDAEVKMNIFFHQHIYLMMLLLIITIAAEIGIGLLFDFIKQRRWKKSVTNKS